MVSTNLNRIVVLNVEIVLLTDLRRKIFTFWQIIYLFRISYRCQNGAVAGGMEALLLLLRRMTYPNRLSDLCQLFERPEPGLRLYMPDYIINSAVLLKYIG